MTLWFRNGIPHSSAPTKTATALASPPCPAESTKGKDHGFRKIMLGLRTLTARILITKVYKERMVYMQNAHQAWDSDKQWWTDCLHSVLFPQVERKALFPSSERAPFRHPWKWPKMVVNNIDLGHAHIALDFTLPQLLWKINPVFGQNQNNQWSPYFSICQTKLPTP